MKIPKDMIPGSTHKTRCGGLIQVLEYMHSHRVRVAFIETGYETISSTTNIRLGNIKDKMSPSLFGVGFLGGDYYKCDNKGIDLKCYDTWRNMLGRCYSERALITHPTYKDCEVCEEWQNYQNFAKWYEENYPGEGDWHIDKDIKSKGNKIYSPEHCSFVSARDNIIEMNERVRMREVRLRSPSGDVFKVLNVTKFCRENGLRQPGMSRLINKKQTNYKGWTLA